MTEPIPDRIAVYIQVDGGPVTKVGTTNEPADVPLLLGAIAGSWADGIERAANRPSGSV